MAGSINIVQIIMKKGIKFRDWWTETELAGIGKNFAFKIEDDGHEGRHTDS